MRGTNPQRPPLAKHDGSWLVVHSIFATLQGEGPRAGQPAVFVRLAGCNLACPWCDTEFEDGATRMETDDVIERVLSEGRRWTDADRRWGVVITGGEPLRQYIVPLINTIALLGPRWVQVETSGSAWNRTLEWSLAEVVCSPKTPHLHPSAQQFAHVFKYVIRSGEVDEDGLPTRSAMVPDSPPARPRSDATVYLMPMDEGRAEDNARNMHAAAAAAIQHGYQLTIQLHKLTGIA